MNKILNKRIIRDLKENFARYFALFFLILLCMYVVISVVGAGETIVEGTKERAEENMLEDGEFGVFLPLSKEQEDELTDMGIVLEKMFSLDLEIENEKMLRCFKNRRSINLFDIDEGRLADKNNEAALEKRFCEENDLAVGDTIEIYGENFLIVGIGSTPDYDAPLKKMADSSAESESFGTIFVTDSQYEKLLKSGKAKAEDYTYAYRLNGKLTDEELKQKIMDFDFDYTLVEERYFKELIADTIGKKDDLISGIDKLNTGANELTDGIKALEKGIPQLASVTGSCEELRDGIEELKNTTDDVIDEFFDMDIDNLTSFVKAADNTRILFAAGDKQIDISAGLLAGVIIMALFTYVISVFVVHQIQKESSVIGALYALGAKKKNLISHYIMLPALIALIGGVIGTVIAFSPIGIPVQMRESYSYNSIPKLSMVHPVYLFVYSIIMPPVVAMIVNYLVINGKLSRTALSLIKNEQKTKHFGKINLGNLGFVKRFQLRQLLREMRTGITVILGMTIALCIFMLGLNCYVLCDNVKKESIEDTKFQYMYTLKYPEKEIPEDAAACYMESLTKEYLGYTLNVSIIGIDKDNPYFDAKPVKSKNKVVVSDSVCQKYGLSIGDKLILSDEINEIDYAFTVDGVCDYANGLSIFMDIDSMRELFSEEEDYYNVLLSDRELDIDEGRIYSLLTKNDVKRSAGIFADMMKGLVTLLTGVSVIVFCVVMYLMLGVMIDRAGFGISLVKIFGFRKKEIRKLYLNGNLLTVFIGSCLAIPIAKKSVDSIYPVMIANACCGMNTTFKWYYYVMIFVGILLIYVAVSTLLMRKINRITPAEVLKNRE